MTTRRKRLAVIALLLAPPALWVAGEAHYARRIRPAGVRTLAQHFGRFGAPQFIYEVRRGGQPYYELQDYPGGRVPLLAAPSSPPAYIYDRGGLLVDWCPDPGDMPGHRREWPRTSGAQLDTATFRARFGL